MRFAILFFFILGNSLCFSISSATIIIPVHYTNYDLNPDKLVRAIIKNIKPIMYVKNDKLKQCGWEIDVEVLESWKGGNESFVMYSSDNDFFMGLIWNIYL